MQKCKLHILSQTPNGKIFKCLTCDKIHVEYKNLNFVFTKARFEFFKDYFLELDAGHWECVNKHTLYSRKIMVPIGHRNFSALFSAEEIYELKSMFGNIGKKISDYEFIDMKKMRSGPFMN